MQRAAVLLLCLACIGHGRQVQPRYSDAKLHDQSLEAFAKLLLAFNPTDAFNQFRQGVVPRRSVERFAGHSPVMRIGLTSVSEGGHMWGQGSRELPKSLLPSYVEVANKCVEQGCSIDSVKEVLAALKNSKLTAATSIVIEELESLLNDEPSEDEIRWALKNVAQVLTPIDTEEVEFAGALAKAYGKALAISDAYEKADFGNMLAYQELKANLNNPLQKGAEEDFFAPAELDAALDRLEYNLNKFYNPNNPSVWNMQKGSKQYDAQAEDAQNFPNAAKIKKLISDLEVATSKTKIPETTIGSDSTVLKMREPAGYEELQQKLDDVSAELEVIAEEKQKALRKSQALSRTISSMSKAKPMFPKPSSELKITERDGVKYIAL